MQVELAITRIMTQIKDQGITCIGEASTPAGYEVPTSGWVKAPVEFISQIPEFVDF